MPSKYLVNNSAYSRNLEGSKLRLEASLRIGSPSLPRYSRSIDLSDSLAPTSKGFIDDGVFGKYSVNTFRLQCLGGNQGG